MTPQDVLFAAFVDELEKISGADPMMTGGETGAPAARLNTNLPSSNEGRPLSYVVKEGPSHPLYKREMGKFHADRRQRIQASSGKDTGRSMTEVYPKVK